MEIFPGAVECLGCENSLNVGNVVAGDFSIRTLKNGHGLIARNDTHGGVIKGFRL